MSNQSNKLRDTDILKKDKSGVRNVNDYLDKVEQLEDDTSNIQNYGVATKLEAEAGTSNNKYMTPLRVKEAGESRYVGKRSMVLNPGTYDNLDVSQVDFIMCDTQLGDITINSILPSSGHRVRFIKYITENSLTIKNNSLKNMFMANGRDLVLREVERAGFMELQGSNNSWFGNVSIGSSPANKFAVYNGTVQIDPNTTTDAYIVTQHTNVPPSGGFFHIYTYFYESVSANRAQIAIKYSGDDEMYIRKNVGGTWYSWRKILHDDAWVEIQGLLRIGGQAGVSYIQAGQSNSDTNAELRITRKNTSNQNIQKLEIFSNEVLSRGNIQILKNIPRMTFSPTSSTQTSHSGTVFTDASGTAKWVAGHIPNNDAYAFYDYVAGRNKLTIESGANGYVKTSDNILLDGSELHMKSGTGTKKIITGFGGDGNGIGVTFGGGGATVVYSGEADVQVTPNVSATAEHLWLSSDNGVYFLSGLQNGWGNHWEMVYNNSGNLHIQGNNIFLKGVTGSNTHIRIQQDGADRSWIYYNYNLDCTTVRTTSRQGNNNGYLNLYPDGRLAWDSNDIWHHGNSPKTTVSSTAPSSPKINDIWIQT